MSRDLVTSLYPSHSRDAKVVFDDMTDTKTLPKVTPVPSVSSEKKATAKSSESKQAVSKQPRKNSTLAKNKRRKKRKAFSRHHSRYSWGWSLSGLSFLPIWYLPTLIVLRCLTWSVKSCPQLRLKLRVLDLR